MTDLDPRVFGVAPRLHEAGPDGDVVYTTAGVMLACGFKSKITLYNTPSLMGLRRDFSDGATPRWRWLKAEVDAWMAARPQALPTSKHVVARKLAQKAKKSKVSAAAQRGKLMDAHYRAQGEANLAKPHISLVELLDATLTHGTD